LQLNGRKYSFLHSGLVHLILAMPIVVVAADKEAFHGFCDALLTVLAEPYGELSLVASEQLGKMGSEEPLQRACAPRAVRARCIRIHGQSELACHA
jgi:hypothetical protein